MDDETRCYNAFLWLLDQPSSNLSSWRLSFVFSSSHDGWPYIYMYIAIDRSFPPATHIFLRARFQLFTGKNSVRTNERTNERLAAVKRQTRRFKGWMHLTLKEPHSAPLSCVIFQPVQAYSSPPNQRCNTADVARITRNLPHYSPFRKNLFAYARRVTPTFFLALALAR